MIVNTCNRYGQVALEMKDEEFCWLVMHVYGVNRSVAVEVLKSLRSQTSSWVLSLDYLVSSVLGQQEERE